MKDLEYIYEKISYSNETTCINSNNLDLIEQALIRILEKEGYRNILKPPLPQDSKPIIQEFLSCSWKIKPYLWIFGLSHSKSGWTIIKSSVPGFLCSRAKKTAYPRLSELARQTSSKAFHHSVQQRYWGALLEVNAAGRTITSGDIDCVDPKKMRFYSELVVGSRKEQNFLLLNVPKEFQEAGKVKNPLSEAEKRKGEAELEDILAENSGAINILLSNWKKLNMSNRERLDEDLGQLLCTSQLYWHENNLLYKAFAEPEKLEKDGVRLLFFQVGQFHLNPNTEEIWSPITSREDYGKDPWTEIPF